MSDPEISQSAVMSFTQSSKPVKIIPTDAKYEVGQMVYFFGFAGQTDDLFHYPCIGQGKITDCWQTSSLPDAIIRYSIEHSLDVDEDEIFLEFPDAQSILDGHYDDWSRH